MLSPAGAPEKPADFDINKMKFGKSEKTPSKLGVYVMTKVWNKKWSPFGVMRTAPKFISKKIIKSFLNRRMKNLP